MPPSFERIDEIAADFANRGIIADAPGFFDDPAFMAAEAEDPKYLANYARFIEHRELSRTDRRRSAACALVVAKEVGAAVAEDGRPGLCVNVCAAMSRMLDAQGVWNYVVRGNALVRVRSGPCLLEAGFHAVDVDVDHYAHSWLVVPPWRVIDVTLAQQGFQPEVARALWSPVAIRSLEGPRIEVPTLYSDVAANLAIARYGSVEEDARVEYPFMMDLLRWFPGGHFRKGAATLAYQTTGIIAPDERLEGMLGIQLAGKSFDTVYRERVLPALRARGLALGV